MVKRLQKQIAAAGNASSPQLAAVQQRLAALRSLAGLPDPTLTILNRADSPGVASKPSAKLIYLASAIAGLLLGFAIALIADSFGGKIRREDDLLLRDRLPVLARVPKLSQATVTEYLGGRANLPGRCVGGLSHAAREHPPVVSGRPSAGHPGDERRSR